MPQRGVPAGAVVLLGVVLVIGAYAGWYRLSGEGRLPAETVAPVPERLATLAEQAVPPPPPATPPAPVVVAAAPAPPQPAEEPAAPPVPSISPSSAAAAAVTPPPSMAAPAAQPEAPAPDQPRIVVQATADAWLQVRDRNGGVLLNKVLHNGESWPVPPRPNLVLTTGNAGGTELVVDGVATQVPGGSGAVRRDLPLDADLIKGSKLAQPAAYTPQPNGTVSSYGTAQTGGTGNTGTTNAGTTPPGGARQSGGTAPANSAQSATQ
jgi:cytoskeleton protein RodZ